MKTKRTMDVTTGAFLCLCGVVGVVYSQEFLPSPSEVTAVKGEPATLPCKIKDLGSFRVLWSFERVLLTFDTRRISDDARIEVLRPYVTEWNLKIDAVKEDDAGMYSCQINTNPVTRHDVKLIVLKEKPKPAAPKEVVVFSGSDVSIPCKLPDFGDIATWSYKADSRSERRTLETTDGPKFRSISGKGVESHVQTLEIKDVRTSDEGLYYCRARSGADTEIAVKVVVPPPPPTLEAKARSPNEVQVRWKRPQAREAEVVGYDLYVQDYDTGKEYVIDVQTSGKENGDEEHTIDDLTTQSTYTVQVATRLSLGDTVTIGKKSSEVNITTPLFVPDPPTWVKAMRVTDDAAEIVWAPAQNKSPGIVRGYTVIYGALSNDKKLSKQMTNVRVDKPDGNKWRARLTGLKPKIKYLIRVAAYTRKGDGQPSKPLTYLHKTLPPDLSLNGRVLSTNSVLLTVNSLGSSKMTNVKMFYTEADEPSWKSLDFSQDWKFTVVGGLEPKTSYFFKVKAKLGGKLKHSTTHITTPPHELITPQSVQVSATASTSINVKWDYVLANDSSPTPLGYIVHLEETKGKDEAGKQHSQSVVFNMTSVEVKDLIPGSRYTVSVGAFNGFGEGPRTDPLLFHIAESDVKMESINQPFPPKFTHALPERITVEEGETVKITCVAEGSPVPEVSWYDRGEPIGVGAQGSNQLYLANVLRSTVLTCRAVSEWGTIESSTVVDVLQTDEDPDSAGFTLRMVPEKVRTTTLTAAWTIADGDPESIQRFIIDIKDAQGRVLLSRPLPSQTRSFNLHTLQPGTEYKIELKAFDLDDENGEPAATAQLSVTTLTEESESKEDATTKAPDALADTDNNNSNKYRAQIPLKVLNVRHSSATIEWDFLGLDPRYVQLYELKVKSRSNFTLLTKSLTPNLKLMELNLQPDEFYYVQVRAFDRQGEVLAENTTEVVTSTKTTTAKPGDGGKDDESPVLRQARLTLSTHAITGDSARLDWTLTGANIGDVSDFSLIVRDTSDRTLLRQDMARESRSLTLSNLTPKTTYRVELNALDDKGATIARQLTELTTTTQTADVIDENAPLRVFTEELDQESVKIAWDTPPRLLQDISSITVTLYDVANMTLLEQQMSGLTRSLTVRNLQAGERYKAHVQALGARKEVLKSGNLIFDTNPTPGMPGRPQVYNVEAVNNSAVYLQWRNTPSPAPAPESEDVTGYVINFASVDQNDLPTRGTYQFPLFGSVQSVVIPNLKGGERYMFQVAARNKYDFGPLSSPVFAQVPRN